MQTMTETDRKVAPGRIQLAFRIDSRLPAEGLRAAVERAREGIDAPDRDRIEFAPPIRVKAPLPKLAFASGCASFVVALLKHLIAGGRGGTIIDLREKTPVISRDRALPMRTVRILAGDGAKQIDASTLPESSLDATLERLLRLPATGGGDGVRTGDVATVVNRAKTGRDRPGQRGRETVVS